MVCVCRIGLSSFDPFPYCRYSCATLGTVQMCDHQALVPSNAGGCAGLCNNRKMCLLSPLFSVMQKAILLKLASLRFWVYMSESFSAKIRCLFQGVVVKVGLAVPALINLPLEGIRRSSRYIDVVAYDLGINLCNAHAKFGIFCIG